MKMIPPTPPTTAAMMITSFPIPPTADGGKGGKEGWREGGREGGIINEGGSN